MSEDITVTVLDLLNLSLGTPEIGAVNFNLLHRFLLELVKHLSLARKQIEITDDYSIQSALEELRVLSSTKSQTHVRAYSSFSEQADSKRLSELRGRDSSTALESGKRGSIEIKSRDSVSGSDKCDAIASGSRGKEGITESTRPGEASSRKGQVVEANRSTGENRNGQVTEQVGNLQANRSKDEQMAEKTESKESLQTKCDKEQVIETIESKENLRTTRSTGEMKSTEGAESRKNTSEEEGIKSTDAKDTKENAKQRSPDEKSQLKPESPLSRRSPVVKSRTYSPPGGRSGSSHTKGSKRASPASSKTDVRKRSFMEMAVPGLTQLERKISILEAKFESLSAAPTNLEIVQQARDLQSKVSSTSAAGDMWQTMNLVRRIEVAEGAIDGITAMLDDISEQLNKIKENSPNGQLNELSNKLLNVTETMAKLGPADLPAKFAEINGKLKNIVHKNDLKPFLTVKKMNDIMDYKLQNYRQMSPTTPKSPKNTPSSRIAQPTSIESRNQLAHDQLTPLTSSHPGLPDILRRKSGDQVEDKMETTSLTTSSEPRQHERTERISSEQAEIETARSGELAQPETATTRSTEQAQMDTTALAKPSESAQLDSNARRSSEKPNTETTASTISGEQVETDASTNVEEEAPGSTVTTPISERVESELDNDEAVLAEMEDREGRERSGSLTTEAFEELYKTMQDWCDFREEAALRINNLEENLSNTVDSLNNLASSQQQVKTELTLLKGSPLEREAVATSVASQHDLSQLESSLEERLQALSKSLLEMKQNFFQMYEMKETVGGLKESDDHVKADLENIRKEVMKIMKQLDDEQEVRKAFANAIGRKHSFNAGDSDELHHLRSSLSEIKNEIEKHNSAMSQVIDDQNKKQLHLETLYGHVDQLENAKADRQQINRDIEVKADRKDLEKKVSHDKFHNSLSSLDQSVQDLVEKLVGHEATLKQAVNHITLDVNSKLDKMDMDTVKDYFEGKLKDLNSKVQRKPSEDKSQAAASRCMLLQPANCISCDKPVHLYREGAKLPSLPFNNPLPRTKSNRPYMTFDLGDVRQKMHDVQNPRGKEQPESLGQAKVQSELLKLGAIKEDDEFPEIAHRPCGGNHTLTCPEKRTTIRVNKAYREDLHFIAQLSQKDLSIVDILGYDGHVYKGHVNQLPSIPEIPKNTMARRPTTGSGRPRTSSPI